MKVLDSPLEEKANEILKKICIEKSLNPESIRLKKIILTRLMLDEDINKMIISEELNLTRKTVKQYTYLGYHFNFFNIPEQNRLYSRPEYQKRKIHQEISNLILLRFNQLAKEAGQEYELAAKYYNEIIPQHESHKQYPFESLVEIFRLHLQGKSFYRIQKQMPKFKSSKSIGDIIKRTGLKPNYRSKKFLKREVTLV